MYCIFNVFREGMGKTKDWCSFERGMVVGSRAHRFVSRTAPQPWFSSSTGRRVVWLDVVLILPITAYQKVCASDTYSVSRTQLLWQHRKVISWFVFTVHLVLLHQVSRGRRQERNDSAAVIVSRFCQTDKVASINTFSACHSPTNTLWGGHCVNDP